MVQNHDDNTSINKLLFNNNEEEEEKKVEKNRESTEIQFKCWLSLKKKHREEDCAISITVDVK